MLFSIIIPVYNRAKVVQQTLDTVVAQTHRPLQVVLVDNHSEDNTLEVLEQFKDKHDAPDFQVVVTQEEQHTAGAARNRGFDQATGQWVMFFDSDDQMEPTLVEEYARQVEKHQGQLDIISARAWLCFPDGTRREAPFFRHDMMAVQILHSQLATQRYAVRRDFFAETKRWDAELPVWNDWELGIRLLLKNPRLAWLKTEPLILINHNRTDSITGTEFHTRAGLWECSLDLAEDAIRISKVKDQERYNRLIYYRRLVLAAHYEREGALKHARLQAKIAYKLLWYTYDNSLYWDSVVKPITQWLYRRIVKGKRGSARIARRLF